MHGYVSHGVGSPDSVVQRHSTVVIGGDKVGGDQGGVVSAFQLYCLYLDVVSYNIGVSRFYWF